MQHVDENGNLVRNFEELFMCPFVDKAWLLEHYGNIHVEDINDPTNIHRLHQKGNQEPQIQTLIQFIKDCKLFPGFCSIDPIADTHMDNLRIRVVELLVSMLQQGYQEQVILVAECFGSFKDDVLKTLCLGPSEPALNIVSTISKKREYVLKKCMEIEKIHSTTSWRADHNDLEDFMDVLYHVSSFEAEEMIFENLQILISNGSSTSDHLGGFWNFNSHIGERVVHRLWYKCLTKDPKAANVWARYATAIFTEVLYDSKIKLVDHLMSLTSSEQDLQNFFHFNYSQNTMDFFHIPPLFKSESVSIVFKRFILRCCMNMPDSMRNETVKECLICFGIPLGVNEKIGERYKVVRASMIINFGDLVPEELIEKAADEFNPKMRY